MSTLARDTPADQLIAGTWYGFTLDHDELEAAAFFERRYGKQPDYIIERLGLLRLGPIPAREEEAHGSV